ncbi:hypothetical protein [Williamsia sp.]|uniref:5-methylcytosine restriction system specificity protein McrC n=1 Tax=Williamsia sp. TaxID=1872085 RepID=UPI001A1AF89F|nr:hypothetical protein [Williamsia sp.]MBJ7289183.1 hypothetical protein [Williamsia sp.]
MTSEIVFRDLSRLVEPAALTIDDDRWLASLAAEADTAALSVPLHGAAPRASQWNEPPEPLLTRQLDGSWRAGRFIGEIRRGDRVLRIEPRLGLATIAKWANAALNVRIFETSASKSGMGFVLAELQGAMWKRSLLRASRHGPLGVRRPTLHVGTTVRGRLDIGRSVQQLARGNRQLVSVSAPKSYDNPATAAIYLASRVLDRDISRPDWKGSEVETVLAHIRMSIGPHPRLPRRRELDRVRYSPITQSYKGVAELSWRIAKNRTLGSSARSDDVDGVLLDVAELWELFLVRCMQKAAGSRFEVVHGTLAGATPLLRSTVDPARQMGSLYPDIVVSDELGPRLIVDAKYKRLDASSWVVREDLYQLTSYLLAHAGGRDLRGALAYPEGESAESVAEQYGPWSYSATGTPSLESEFLRLPTDADGCVEAMAALLKK